MKIEVYTFSAIIQLVFVKELLSSQETIAEGKISMLPFNEIATL